MEDGTVRNLTDEDHRRLGTPITTEQAVRAILRRVQSPVLGDIELDSGPGHTFRRIFDERDGLSIHDMLSDGERRLVDIAYSVWQGSDDEGARIAAIGGLDRDNRRLVLSALAYLYLGRDLSVAEVDPVRFRSLFE